MKNNIHINSINSLTKQQSTASNKQKNIIILYH